MLRTILVSSGLLLFATAVGARERCEVFELAELKAMPVEKLKLNYCLNAISIDSQKGKGDRALKMSGLEVQSPIGIDRRRIAQLRQEEENAGALASRCQRQNERILDVLGQKKANKVLIMRECPSK